MSNLTTVQMDQIIVAFEFHNYGSNAQFCNAAGQQFGKAGRTIRNLIDKWLVRKANGEVVPKSVNPKSDGKVGVPHQMTDLVRQQMYAITQRLSDDQIYCTPQILRDERTDLQVRGRRWVYP